MRNFALLITTSLMAMVIWAAYLDEDVWCEVKNDTWKGVGIAGIKYKPESVVTVKCRGASNTPCQAIAGDKVRLTVDFEGDAPKFPVKLYISLVYEGQIRWEEDVWVNYSNFIRFADNVWRIEFDYKLPTYIGSCKVKARIESPSIRCIGGALPETALKITALKFVPGWEKPHKGSVKTIEGSPYFAIDGEAKYALWGASPSRYRPDHRNRHSDAPLTFVSVWTDNIKWWARGEEFNPANFDHKAEAYARENPEAYFIWDLRFYPPVDWRSANPNEIAQDEQGNLSLDCGDHEVNWSVGSKKAMEMFARMMKKAIDYLEHSPYANRIVGYRINSGHTIEWLGWFPKKGTTLDFSPAAQHAFAEYAEKYYPQLKDRSVPKLAERVLLDADNEMVWDEQAHLKSIAYHHFISDANVGNLITLCNLARKLTNGNKLIGTYYGYLGQFQGGAGQMMAHFSLNRLLEAHAVDFLMSPQEYPGRDPGMSCLDMKPFSAITKAGIVSAIEDDTRTHNMPSLDRIIGQTYNETMTTSILRRNMGISMCRNMPFYTLALTTGTEFDYPQFVVDATSMRIAGEFAIKKGVKRNSEIAYVVSEENVKSSPMLNVNNIGADTWEESWQRYRHEGKVERGSVRSGGPYAEVHRHVFNRLAKIGAPVDMRLLEELVKDVGNYKVYIFAACCRTSPEFVALADKLRQRDVTIVWTVAPGYADAKGKSLENVKRLTGMNLEKVSGKMEPGVILQNGKHSGFTKNPIAPLFYVRDADEVIGTYTNGLAGLAAVKTDKARSIYSGAARIETDVYREIVRQAGVFVYSDNRDPIEANSSFITLHACRAGTKTIKLPRKTSVVDVFNHKLIAKDIDRFTFDSPLHNSWLFYYGDDAETLLEEVK